MRSERRMDGCVKPENNELGGLVPVDLAKIFLKIKKGKAIRLSVPILDPMYMYLNSLIKK